MCPSLHIDDVYYDVTTTYYCLPQCNTGIRGLMRGMATFPQGNQKLLVVRDKVEDPQVSLG